MNHEAKESQTESQVLRLFTALMSGIRIDRVFAWRRMEIADLRSRICNVEKTFDIVIDRETKKGKRYLEYYIKPPRK